MDLKDLYRDLIVEHKKNPRNFRRLDGSARHAEGFNPVCGDRLTVYLDLDGERVSDVSFEGDGCAISVASASLMTEALKGRTRAEAQELFDKVRALLTGGEGADAGELGKVAALAGVRDFPTRVKCATLCWHTMRAALAGRKDPVTTE